MKDQSAVLEGSSAELNVPAGAADLNRWLNLERPLAFLGRNALSDSLIINMAAGHFRLVSVFVPRNRIKDYGKALRTAAVMVHGSLQAHFRLLVQQCDEAIQVVTRAFERALAPPA